MHAFYKFAKVSAFGGRGHPPPALTPYGRLCWPYIVTKTCLSENEGLVTPLNMCTKSSNFSAFSIFYQYLCSEFSKNTGNLCTWRLCHAVRKYFSNENFVIYGVILFYTHLIFAPIPVDDDPLVFAWNEPPQHQLPAVTYEQSQNHWSSP